jgi:hypothetical protein
MEGPPMLMGQQNQQCGNENVHTTKSIYVLNAIHIKLSVAFFIEIGKYILEFI